MTLCIIPPIERPNTVAGLIAKRDELVKLRKHLEAEARKVTVDIDHLEAAIALFQEPSSELLETRYRVKHKAKKGAVRRFVLAMLRDAPGPLTSRDITEAWMAERGLVADEATFVLIRKRIGSSLIALRADGLVTNGPGDGEYKGWKLA